MTIVAGTGHRGDKLIGGWEQYPHNLKPLIRLLELMLEYYNISETHSGMALGYDTALALATLNTGRKLHCQIPYANFDHRWRKDSREQYEAIVQKADYVNFVNPDSVFSYGEACYWLEERNKVLVHSAPLIFALWNGGKGGTRNCLDYAHSQSKEIVNLWDLYYNRNKIGYG